MPFFMPCQGLFIFLALFLQRAFELVVLEECISTNRVYIYTATVFVVYCVDLTWEVTAKSKITDL